MRVEHWMQTPVQTVSPDDTVATARALMEGKTVDHLPVVSHNHVVGMVTDRDLRAAVPAGGDPDSIKLETAMTRRVRTLAPDRSLADAARLMVTARVGALPVIEDDSLVGIITRTDVLEAFIGLDESFQNMKRPVVNK